MPLELLVTPSTDTTPPVEVTPRAWGDKVVEVALLEEDLAWDCDEGAFFTAVVEVDFKVVEVVVGAVVGEVDEPGVGVGVGATGEKTIGVGAGGAT